MFKYSKKIRKMLRERYFDHEKSQCVLQKAQGTGCSQIQRMFRIRYNMIPSIRSSIDRWYDDYRTRGTYQHRGGNGSPQILDRVKSEIHQKINDPNLSLRETAIQFNIQHTTVRIFFKKRAQDVSIQTAKFIGYERWRYNTTSHICRILS